MNTAPLAKYAPEARRDFIAAVTAEAVKLGITESGIANASLEGDVLLVEGRAFPRAVTASRAALVQRVEADGFAATMDAVAYTWFNRLVAIRYMEVHGYLDHGYRVLSHPSGGQLPEILSHAADVELPGLDREKVVELKLDGTRDEELYQMLLKAQCNALHQAMPFLFDEVGGASEVLLPGNLLQTDSLICRLVESIDEELWQDIEIIGWLYQFYISEKKDEVIGKVVKSEDIPAATQLFTPNWIVKYMVQNSLGAQWLATYPESPLKGQMEYYIEPAEQTDEVNAQLASITPSQLNPEELTLIDPASGSGHILVEAYELFKAIYLERGYRQRDVPQLILEKNLFGLDIDERAAQLTGFALMMKGRADDRRLFERGVKLNVMALVDSAGFDAEGLAQNEQVRVELSDYGLQPGNLTELKRLFEHATTFGSLIQVPEELASSFPALKQLSEVTSQDLFVSEALKRLGPLVQQAELLAAQYDAVVANPPYMGSGAMAPVLKSYVRKAYFDANKDLFACFIEVGLRLTYEAGRCSMITMHSWMFLRSYEALRIRLVSGGRLRSLLHLGAGAFASISGEVVQTAAFVLNGRCDARLRPVFYRLVEGGESQKAERLLQGSGRFDALGQDRFSLLPGSPVAYWLPPNAIDVLSQAVNLGDITEPRKGMCTRDNDYFVRNWSEVSVERLCFTAGSREEALASGRRWFPYQKGGTTRTWFGNHDSVVDWERDGYRLLSMESLGWSGGSTNHNLEFIFKPALVWKKISGAGLSCRFSPAGFLYDDASGVCGFDEPSVLLRALAYLNSVVGSYYMGVINPTLNIQPGNMAAMPVVAPSRDPNARSMIRLAEKDWAVAETAWDFRSLPLLTASTGPTPTLESSYTAWVTQNKGTIAEMKRLEEENNRLFIDAYGLADELTPDVPIEQITLTVNPAYRYGGKLTEEEQWTRFRQDTMEELVSYAIGCMMGRYSLDAPGLIYAHSGNEGFDPSQYTTFPADDDGIVPLTDTEWFEDDACNRVIEFLSKAWPAEHLEANLTFLAENLSPKKSESSRDTLRRYLTTKFFKDHLQGYKKRPIYWLFSSGKQKAFQCLVYLHRYNEGTLARMRAEYVIPLQGKLADRLERLEGDIQAATSSAQTKRLEKERTTLQKQQTELQTFDEKLRHYADMRIAIDLDDGVKVNYGKFGDLLAEVKAVHGKKPELV